MKTLTRGANTVIDRGPAITARLRWSPRRIGDSDVDPSAFLLGADDRVRSDADFIFYNQPASADGSVSLGTVGDEPSFVVQLDRVPSDVQAIAFALTIHGEGAACRFASAEKVTFEVDGVAAFEAPTTGMSESALIVARIYRRNGTWKVRAVGQGFAGGLGPLATHFGVDIADDDGGAAPPAPDASAIRLEKKLVSLQKKAPELVSLVKKVQLSLEKKAISRDQAKVALCLDISASMGGLYRSGKIDTLVRRVMALGYRFDDDGEIDVFLFGADAHEYGTVTVSDYKTFVRDMLARHRLEGGTYYGKAMGMIRDAYRSTVQRRDVPVYVMFVTDGATADRERAVRELREASGDPIFWQFMAIGKKPKKKGFFGRIFGSGFEFLEELDDMPGREVDNADFFLLEDPAGPSDDEMFDLMMDEYPGWLRCVMDKGILK